MLAIPAAKNCRATIAVAAVLYLWAPASTAQTLAISCADPKGRPIQSVQRTTSVIARASLDESGRPIIEVDPRSIDGVTTQERLFVYAHECGHLALGHDVNQPFTPAQEQAADCQAIQALRRVHAYDLDGCLPEVAARRAAATRLLEVRANDCVVHNDAENAIVNASRDRLTINGFYLVGNRCAQVLRCTFTIQVGTLPDADADAGSWRNFHVQKTMMERLDVPANGERGEHRFRSAVDNVPPGESVDFRVLPECQW